MCPFDNDLAVNADLPVIPQFPMASSEVEDVLLVSQVNSDGSLSPPLRQYLCLPIRTTLPLLAFLSRLLGLLIWRTARWCQTCLR